MNWSTLLKDFKEKVGFSSQTSISLDSVECVDFVESRGVSDSVASASSADDNDSEVACSGGSVAREKYGPELDFKKFWEKIHYSSSGKEKEAAFGIAVDIFCKLAKEQYDVAQLVTTLVEAHTFPFDIGRAFVTNIEKLRIHNKEKSLDVGEVMDFFSELKKDDINLGLNLLYAVEVLVSGSFDKQPLLDSGILCCFIYILNAFLNYSNTDQGESTNIVNLGETFSEMNEDSFRVKHLVIEGSIVYIMKALASHPSAARSLIGDDSLQLLFQIVATGSLSVFLKFKHGHIPLHTIQLYRHAMQILGLLLFNDNGSTAKYIQKRQLINVLLRAVKDFNPDDGDCVYTMGVVDLLMECVELSYRPEAGSIRLKDDIHNGHSYRFLVQFAFILSDLQKKKVLHSVYSQSNSGESPSFDDQNRHVQRENTDNDKILPSNHSPALSRLLDVLVNLAQTSSIEPTVSAERIGEENWKKGNTRVGDLEAIQSLQDIFLNCDSLELQAEVLNRMFGIFSSHLDNYKLCQQLRTIPLFILNMSSFPESLQEVIFKILEYAVTVVNCVLEQELLSLCCLLQQPITSDTKHTILSFFVKLLSFDQRYKKVLHEVGVLEVLIDDLKRHRFIIGIGVQSKNSSKLIPMFEDEGTVHIAWDCLDSLLKKAEDNQSSFRSADGFTIALPFLISDIHRSEVLWILSSLIIEDTHQVHPKELRALIEILKSGVITNALGSQCKLLDDAKCDIFEAMWRILRANDSAKRVFGESTGFSLLLITLRSFQNDGDIQPSLPIQMKVVSFLLRVITAAVSNSAINRSILCTILLSQTFYNLLRGSSLLSVDWETQIVHLLLELALEIVIPPSNPLQARGVLFFDVSNSFLSNVPSGSFRLDKERIYNGSAVGVLIHSLLLFSPKLQLDLLIFIQKLALASSFNQESLTSIGCVGLLLGIIKPFLMGSSSFLVQTLRIIQILGAYRLSTSELRVLVRYIYEMKTVNSGNYLVNMMLKLIQAQDTQLENVALAPFVEMDMSKMGHACIQVSLGERTWPPTSGYSFVCWLQYNNFLKDSVKERENKSKNGYVTCSTRHILRIFSVGSVDDGDACFAELYVQDNGILTLATSNSRTLCFSGVEMVEKKWHHLAVVHSKPNALAGLFQDSVAYVYLNGKLRHVGNLGYSMSPVGKPLQVTIGTPVTHAKVSDLSWRLRSCYLFEEALTPGSIFFMYILGRGYRGAFQDTNLLQFVPIQACGGGSMAILDTLDVEPSMVLNTQKVDKQGNAKVDNSNTVWDFERLSNISLQLMRKKLIFAFDGTPSDTFKESGTLQMLNLVDPMSAAASAIGGIPRFGRLNGDSYICYQHVIGDSIRPIGGIAVVLSFVEASETKNMLHMSLALLACALHQNPRNVFDMQACRGYHLLAVFLHRRMPLFDMQSLCICFRIAACEEVSYFLEPPKLDENHAVSSYLVRGASKAIFEDLSLQNISDNLSSVGSRGDLDDFTDSTTSLLFKTLDENQNCIVLSNADMVEHVLLEWTLWVTASVSIQLSLLRFLERLVSTHWHKNHNLTLLRKINLVQHLLACLQRGDIEVQILEKIVVLLGIILKDGFIASELEAVVRFAIMTFDPPEIQSHQIIREKMGKHVLVRNMLLEMLIELQISISFDELIEQWSKTVSSKLITCFLDEAVHPSSMRLIITLLGVCLSSSPTYDLEFCSSAGYEDLTRVLPSFYDSPDIYYIIFCLIFGKPVYPRFPEVYMEDFHALMSSDGCYGELKFAKLLDPVIAMAKYTFDRLSIQAMAAQQNNSLLHSNASLAAELVEATSDHVGDVKHKTSSRLMGGEAEAPASATSVLRFMVDLAKMCPPFSSICRRGEFLESCVDLYFSCVRAGCAVNMMNDLTRSLQNSIKDNVTEREGRIFIAESHTKFKNDDAQGIIHNFNSASVEHMMFTTSTMQDLAFCDSNDKPTSKRLTSVNTLFPISPKVLAEIDNSRYGGGACSASATAVLDFIAVMLADIISEQIQATQQVDNILEALPFYVNIESVLVYQGLCLSRFMNFLERRLSRDDEEIDTKLDKSRWSVNMEALSWMIVDRLYMGVFPQTSGVLRTLEFLFSMLHIANKDGLIEEAMPPCKRFLSITRGNSRRVEPYIHALLKNVNRVIMYCFLPSVLIANHDICMILQLIIANKQLVFCPSNHDTEFIHCLCVNLIHVLRDQREFVQNLAVDIMKYMLLHQKAAFEGIFMLKSNHGNDSDVLHEGFDKLLTGSSSAFFEWFYSSELAINRVLKQHASIKWENFITVSEKFRGVRIKGLEDRCTSEMGSKLQDVRNWDRIKERRRYALEHYRNAMSTELRVFRQDKYGCILHAESDWNTFLQQLVHERGIYPLQNSNLESEWQLCPIEGPYRMRKKLQHCKSNTGLIENVLLGTSDPRNMQTTKENDDNGSVTSRSDYEPEEEFKEDFYFKDTGEFHSENSVSAQSSLLDSSFHIMNTESYLGSPRQSSSLKNEDMKITEDKSEKALLDNGEYLIRPYLEPFEKIWLKYNCERVVGLNKHDGIFLIGNLCLYVIENFYIDDFGCIREKQNEDDVSVIDRALGVKNNVTTSVSISDFQSEWGNRSNALIGAVAWSYNGGNLPHLWHMWKFDSIHNILRRDYQLRPVAIEIFSMDGCNNLLVFHKNERDCVFRNLISIDLPRNTKLDATTISGSSKQESNDGNRLLKVMAKSLSKRWQSGEISNFEYLVHLNTLAGRGYSDLTQYPVFPWIIADYGSDDLDLTNTKVFRKLDKTMGCQTAEGEEEYKQRYESWDDPEIPKFNYGSHYSSAGIVLFYLLRLPPFSAENHKLNDGQFDHGDRLFNSIQHTWLSASGSGNVSDVKELIPEFFYMPEFLENRFNLDLGKKQSGEKVGDVVLPPWAKGSAREFIKKHREALECDYVSQNLHHWIDLIFGYKQRGKAAEEATNVFYHYTYEGSVDIDSLSDPTIKASTLAQINNFGQTPKQLFLKPHVKRRCYSYRCRKIPLHLLQHCSHLIPHDVQKGSTSSITQIASFNGSILVAGTNNYVKPPTYNQYLAWGFPDRSLRFLSYAQNKLLSTHENLHGGYQIQCVGVSHDGRILVTGADDGVVAVWRITKEQQLCLERALCGHTGKITCLYVSQSYTLLVTGSDDCTVILWDLSGLTFVKQLEPKFPSPVTAIHVNNLTGDIMTGAGTLLAIWSVNGVCLAIVNTSQLQFDSILSLTTSLYSDWEHTNWFVTGHQSGSVQLWNMIHSSFSDDDDIKPTPEYRLIRRKVLSLHKHPVTALHLTSDHKQLLTGDSAGHLLSWKLSIERLKSSS